MSKARKTTAEKVNELGRQLARFNKSWAREREICREIARLVEAEPNNRELDEWRALLSINF